MRQSYFYLKSIVHCIRFRPKEIDVQKLNVYRQWVRSMQKEAQNSSTEQKTLNYLQPLTESNLNDLEKEADNNALAECKEDVSDYTPYHAPSFNLAAYVNRSNNLQQLVKLGVDLSKLETNRGVVEAVLKLDFEKDVQKYLMFLNDNGVPPEEFGQILTRCPRLLFQDMNNLQIRLDYLQSKSFTADNIVRIVTKNPKWITWRTQDIDYRLGYLQKDFRLSGDEVRSVVVKMPSLVTSELYTIKLNTFAVREEMGFSRDESKAILLLRPKVYNIGKKGLVARFDYLHNEMKLSHDFLAQQPDGLLNRRSRLEARHGFLKSLHRNQYDPTKPNYVSMKALLAGTDAEFASNIAKTSIQTYNAFLKSL